MLEKRRVRLIRKGTRQTNNASAIEAKPGNQQPSEREIKTVVARWVREHRQRSEEFRRNLTSSLLQAGEVALPTR